ncbi:DUF952 domain-containing protein [Demequina soli]|uniref:DUF952 domain-containing protein n=1 Tax=Demequina soli TaxID=1638987 RepID=UPI0009E3DCFD|nr:DUF952 domain-containing protein [Demequina soli]
MLEIPHVYHLALAEDWDAHPDEPYTVSTIGRTLAEEGFIHMSLARQAQGVADSFYRGRDVVLLRVDPARVDSRIQFDHVPDADDDFPHLYGPLQRAAVVAATRVPMREDGTHDLAGLLPEPI